MEQEAKQEPKPGTTTPDSASSTEDLISILPDDMLVRILGLVAKDDMWDVMPTSELSHRWRGLWKRVPALCFTSLTPRFEHDRLPERFIAFVDGTLSLRAQLGSDAIDHLDILHAFCGGAHDDIEQIVPPSISAAQRWIRYAMQHELKSFFLVLYLPCCTVRSYYRYTKDNDDGKGEVANVMLCVDEIPSCATLETLHLSLGFVRVRLTITTVLTSLVDLMLENIVVEGDDSSGHLLAHLVSSVCCPCLQKLKLSNVQHKGNGLEQLVVEAPSLTDLTMEDVDDIRSLKLIAPNLRVLRVHSCFGLQEITGSANWRLEEITCLHNPLLVAFLHGDLSSVSSLGLNLCSHEPSSNDDDDDDDDGEDYDDDHGNDLCISLLRHCKVATCLEVSLEIPQQGISHGVDIIKDRIPQLHQVTSLKLSISQGLWDHHLFADHVASFLAKFTNLRYLHLDFGYYPLNKKPVKSSLLGTVSDLLCNHWESHQFSSTHLQKVEFQGILGTDCELRFLQFMLVGATQLQKVVLGFNRNNHLEDQRDGDFRHRLVGHGIWTNWRRGYFYRTCEWKACG